MKIKSIYTNRQRNDEHLGFMTETGKILEKYLLASIDIPQTFITGFNEALNNEDLSYKIVQKSSLTEKIAALDAASDSILIGFTTQVRAMISNYDVAIQEAANRIMIQYNAYGNIRKKSYVAQTTDITNLLQDFRGKLQPDITLLGLQGWVTQIEDANNAFLEAFNDRHAEQAEKDAMTRLKQCRTVTDERFEAIRDRVNAGIIYNGEAQYKALVIDLNVSIDYYNNLMAQRKGRAAAEKKRKEEAAANNNVDNTPDDEPENNTPTTPMQPTDPEPRPRTN